MRAATHQRSVRWSIRLGVTALLVLVLLLVSLGQRSKSSGPAIDDERPGQQASSAGNAVQELRPAEDSEDLPDTRSGGSVAVLSDVQRSNLPASSSLSNAIQTPSPTNFNLPPGGTNTELVRLELVWIPPGTFVMGSPEGEPQKVGLKKPNGWGRHDTHGNVGEWCLDWLGSSYPGGELVDPVGRLPVEGGAAERWVARGGDWRSSAEGCRSAWRHGVLSPNDTVNAIVTRGFRVVLGPVIEAPADTPDEEMGGR